MDLGFHSLVELLIRHEDSGEAKNDALAEAVSNRRLDLVQLLVEHGAEVASVPFVDVLCHWTSAIIEFLIERGADVVTDDPFAHAFVEKIRTAMPFSARAREDKVTAREAVRSVRASQSMTSSRFESHVCQTTQTTPLAAFQLPCSSILWPSTAWSWYSQPRSSRSERRLQYPDEMESRHHSLEKRTSLPLPAQAVLVRVELQLREGTR